MGHYIDYIPPVDANLSGNCPLCRAPLASNPPQRLVMHSEGHGNLHPLHLACQRELFNGGYYRCLGCQAECREYTGYLGTERTVRNFLDILRSPGFQTTAAAAVASVALPVAYQSASDLNSATGSNSATSLGLYLGLTLVAGRIVGSFGMREINTRLASMTTLAMQAFGVVSSSYAELGTPGVERTYLALAAAGGCILLSLSDLRTHQLAGLVLFSALPIFSSFLTQDTLSTSGVTLMVATAFSIASIGKILWEAIKLCDE